ncbi:RNA polymerase sigma factor [Terriglobus tenax]|uniref:RNA polymerase sigma factor n=1 Tax=Terriglobus tenax TaxID=1111115 RepID=UPI0021E02F4B|nr:RNA polymerase sigma factor [Terriglobus tenax]
MNSVFDQSRLAVLVPAVVRPGRTRVIETEVLALFDLHHAGLLRYAVSFGIAVQDAEDVVQETFFALFRHLLDERPQDNLRSWLFRVTHNLALKRRGAHRHEVAGAEDVPLECTDPAPGPEDALLFTERQLRLRRVMEAMPAADRACLQLRAEGLRYREIAQVLGISLGSVATAVARSVERLERSEGSVERR